MEQQTDLLNEFENSYEYATTGQRFVNYLIDLIGFYAVFFIVSIVFNAVGLYSSIAFIYLASFATFLIYYTVLEGSSGRTLGKLVTKTKAIKVDGSPLNFKNAFLRSLCRMVPFEFFSAFSGGQMWHDRWTDTMVVQNKN